VDIALGVSMTPTAVRMVLVEGEKADGPTVDHDVFDIATSNESGTAQDQVLAAILGTRESAAEGGHRLVSTGVAWRDHEAAAALRDALAARGVDDVMLVSESHAAGALAKAAGAAVGQQRTALMFLERDTATVSVVDTADGTIVKVQHQDLHAEDAVAELGTMLAALEELPAPPQGVFVVGSGVSVAAIKSELAAATSLPLSAPEEPELALARGAALAATSAPLFEASTVGLAYSHDAHEGPTAGSSYAAGAGAAGALAYSEVEPESGDDADLVSVGATPVPQGRKPFLLVGSALTGTFVVGVAALVISLAVSIRPTVDQRPTPENMIVPTQAPPPAAAVPPAPAPAPPPETIPAPKPVVQEAPAPAAPPRTVYVEAPAPAAPPPAPVPAALVPAPAVAAPAPAPAPVLAPPVVIPPPVVRPIVPAPIIMLPKPQLPIIRMPWDPPVRQQPQKPVERWPSEQSPRQQWPGQQVPSQQWPGQQAPQQRWPQQDDDGPAWNPPPYQSPGDYGSGGRDSGGRDSGGRGGGGNPAWPWPILGGGD
jgi:hypothetical protein